MLQEKGDMTWDSWDNIKSSGAQLEHLEIFQNMNIEVLKCLVGWNDDVLFPAGAGI